MKWDGQDIWPLITGEKSNHDSPRRFYWNYWNIRIALRDGDWKLVYPKQNLPAELYNLAEPPGSNRLNQTSRSKCTATPIHTRLSSVTLPQMPSQFSPFLRLPENELTTFR